jgi:transposase
VDIVHPRVAGIDVHKKAAWVAVWLPGEAPGERKVAIKRFKTFWRSLQKMAAWLAELGVTDTAVESTGVYWWPVYHALAGAGIEVCVCNAAHMRNVPGRKTDLKDCQWIAELHEYGLLRPSFIPAAEVAALRQRTRYRKRLIEARTAESQRLSKVLEDAGIKIDSVASRLLGKSGREIALELDQLGGLQQLTRESEIGHPHRDTVEAVKLLVKHGGLPQVGGIKPGITENATEDQLDRSRQWLVP